MTSSFSRRGLTVEVETIISAEYDFQLLNISNAQQEKIGASFIKLPISKDDDLEPPARIREFDGFDVCYIISRASDTIVVTLIRVWPTAERELMRELLEKVSMIDMIRGASGL